MISRFFANWLSEIARSLFYVIADQLAAIVQNRKLLVAEIPETRDSLILRLRDPQNHEAWSEFVEIYRPVIYRSAILRGLQHADALDLVQTVLLSVTGSIDKWERSHANVKFRHWLLTVARNATINALKRLQTHQLCTGSPLEEVPDVSTPDDLATERSLDLEYRRQLYLRASDQVRTQVHHETWRAFELSSVRALSIAEVAAELGKPLGSVYAARSRVMKKLLAAVAQLEGAE